MDAGRLLLRLLGGVVMESDSGLVSVAFAPPRRIVSGDHAHYFHAGIGGGSTAIDD